MKKVLWPLLIFLWSCATAPHSPSDYPALTGRNWFINAAVLEGKRVFFYGIPGEWMNRLYLRQYDDCCFIDIVYSDKRTGTVGSHGEKRYATTIDTAAGTIERDDEIGTVYTKQESASNDFYEGGWNNNFGRSFRIAKIPGESWACIMVFPGEAYSAVRPGSYILKEKAPGVLESWDPFDMGAIIVDLTDPERIRIYPKTISDTEYEFLYDPVRLWEAEK